MGTYVVISGVDGLTQWLWGALQSRLSEQLAGQLVQRVAGQGLHLIDRHGCTPMMVYQPARPVARSDHGLTEIGTVPHGRGQYATRPEMQDTTTPEQGRLHSGELRPQVAWTRTDMASTAW